MELSLNASTGRQTPLNDLRVLVIASSPLARAGIAALLSDQPGVSIVGQAAGEGDLADSIAIYRPDIIVWDMDWEPLQSLDRLADARDARLPVVALLADLNGAIEAAATLLGTGVRGLLLQNTNSDDLVAVITAAARGIVALDGDIADAIFADSARVDPSHPGGNNAAAPVEALTARELEVINLIAEGLPNKTIAGRLNISEHTVKFHVNAILTKLGAQSRTEAVVRATRLGLITL